MRVSGLFLATPTLLCTAYLPAYPGVPVAAGAGPRTPANAMKVTTKVELDIFSGRPNPTWTLTRAESDSFAERLADLPRTATHQLSVNLGYRGLIVTIHQPGDDATVRIQKGVAEITEGARISYREDRNRVLERWLIGTAEASMPKEIRQIVQGTFH